MKNLKEESKSYRLAPREIKELVNTLYAECRTDLDGRPNIICIFRSKALISQRKLTIASIKKIGEKENCIHSYYPDRENIDYVIEIAADIWGSLNDIQQCAIIAHELHHIDQTIKDKEVQWSIRKHQIEEFADVLKTYGAYMEDIKDFILETKDVENIKPRSRIRINKSELKVVGE